jgi:hypothetical protein
MSFIVCWKRGGADETFLDMASAACRYNCRTVKTDVEHFSYFALLSHDDLMHFFLTVDFDPRAAPTSVSDVFRLAPRRVVPKGPADSPVFVRGGAVGRSRHYILYIGSIIIY